jgi:serine/threonine protein kinase
MWLGALLECLGKGNFGEVHQGLWQKTPVAIKLLIGWTLTPTQQAEFEHESALLASLNHPNVVRLYGICKDYPDYPLCMILEFASGGALDKLNPHQLHWTTRQRIALDIARGVDYLHQRQIIHGDLRACNILIGKNDTAKVGDFSLAKQRAGNMSMLMTNESTIGDSSWLSPELIRGGARTKASDVYSFGMLWEIMTGTQPFPDAPDWWVALMKACCQPDPAKRPTASEVVERLLAKVEPQQYAAYSRCPVANEIIPAVEQHSRDITRCYQQFESPMEQFTRQIKDCLKKNNLSVAISYFDHLNILLLLKTQNSLRNSLLSFKTSERSVWLFTSFFNEKENVYSEQGKQIASYLDRSGRDTMACVNRGFNSFFSRSSQESKKQEEITGQEVKEVVEEKSEALEISNISEQGFIQSKPEKF